MPRPWSDKFRDALRGLVLAMRGERSFTVHLPMAVVVLEAGVWLRVSVVEACILALCVTIVLAAEMFNTEIEYLAREITGEPRAGIAAALNIASGAVLVTALGAAAIGTMIFVLRLIAV